MDSNHTRRNRRPRKRKERRKTPWSGAELLLFGLSLLLALDLTAGGLAPFVHGIKEARRNAAAAKANHQEYVTFFRDVFSPAVQEEEEAEQAFFVDTAQFAGDNGFAGQVYRLREQYPEQVKTILTYYEEAICTVKGEETTVGEAFPELAIPKRLIQLAAENQEALGFVANYPAVQQDAEAVQAMNPSGTSQVPLYIQWDQKWGYDIYGDGLLGYTGCAPTCLAMAAAYLTGEEVTPSQTAFYADSMGYYTPGSGSTWTLISEGSSHFGLNAQQLNVDEKQMAQALAQGKLIVCTVGPGDFTQRGHFILLTGYQDGSFTVNDPNSVQRSGQSWSYQRIEGQIKNLWSLSAK